MRKTPDLAEVQHSLTKGRAAAANAKQVRLRFRRASNPGGERQLDIEHAINKAVFAARPIRRYIGMLYWHEELAPFDVQLRAVSQELTDERRRLRKMLR